ncbi:hypothetical protein RMATCC62417_07299 [Rhizopus microsporus]|nr:hypothetical protein RMATCC62417_07299 [Rhizopus microsporus]
MATDSNILLVGQVYLDTILTVDNFPEEDSKLRATDVQQRRGGNCLNTAEVLCQFPKINIFLMSALGPKDTCDTLLSQLEAKGIMTSACLYRKEPTPSSYIIQSKQTGTRTIISANTIQDITKNEFIQKIETIKTRFNWIHFEGRNVEEAAAQIDWLESISSHEGWRSRLTISVELEKPDRPDIDMLLSRGDVVFFSKLYAEKRGYDDPSCFLRDYQTRCRSSAILFCTWGAKGATCLHHGNIFHSPALPVEQVIDTIGAGDTFVAGIICYLNQGYELDVALQCACHLASKKVSQFGFERLA